MMNADFASDAAQLLSLAVVLVAFWDLVVDEREYRRGLTKRPTPRKRASAILLVILGFLGFAATTYSEHQQAQEDKQIDATLNAAAQMRIGIRAGLDSILRISSEPASQAVRERAATLFRSVGDDYDAFVRQEIKAAGVQTAWELLERWDASALPKSADPMPEIVTMIRSHQNLNFVAAAFVIFRDKTGVPVRMFDVRKVEEWCESNPSQCRGAS